MKRLLTDAARHPLKNGMEAAGIENASLHRIVGTRHDQSHQFRRLVGSGRVAPSAHVQDESLLDCKECKEWTAHALGPFVLAGGSRMRQFFDDVVVQPSSN
jgi:hypothetical protein